LITASFYPCRFVNTVILMELPTELAYVLQTIHFGGALKPSESNDRLLSRIRKHDYRESLNNTFGERVQEGYLG
jgi:hypothetical protein